MVIASIFNGYGGGMLASIKANIPITKYYYSEIDKYANIVMDANFPDAIPIGDVTKVDASSFNHDVDILMGGSPCQGFSFAGKQLNFQHEQSKLFFEFIRLRDELKPKYILLENVRMAKQSQDVISEYMGFECQALNSSKLSAQNRYRLYWFGVLVNGKYEQIRIADMIDKGIVMQDILEDGYATDEMTNADGKSHCLTARYNGAVWWNSIERKQRTMVLKDNPTVSKDGLIRVGTADLRGHDSIKRVYAQEGKAPTLTTMQGGHREPQVAVTKEMWRKLTPLECERLQTLPDNYTNHVSNSQRYKMIGNGWTVDVIAHILQGVLIIEKYDSDMTKIKEWHKMYNNNKELV